MDNNHGATATTTTTTNANATSIVAVADTTTTTTTDNDNKSKLKRITMYDVADGVPSNPDGVCVDHAINHLFFKPQIKY